jgi:hypothetical protein
MASNRADDVPSITNEIRTRKIVVTDDQDNERAVVEIVQDHIELRLLAGGATDQSEVLLFAGEQAPGTLAAGIELWVNGNSVAGCTAVTTGGEIELHRFP